MLRTTPFSIEVIRISPAEPRRTNPVSPTDLFAIDDRLTPEQREIRDTVRRFADEQQGGAEFAELLEAALQVVPLRVGAFGPVEVRDVHTRFGVLESFTEAADVSVDLHGPG